LNPAQVKSWWIKDLYKRVPERTVKDLKGWGEYQNKANFWAASWQDAKKQFAERDTLCTNKRALL